MPLPMCRTINIYITLFQGLLLHECSVGLIDGGVCGMADEDPEPISGLSLQEPHVALSGGIYRF